MCLASSDYIDRPVCQHSLAGLTPPSLFPMEAAALAAPAMLPLIALPTSAAAAFAA